MNFIIIKILSQFLFLLSLIIKIELKSKPKIHSTLDIQKMSCLPKRLHFPQILSLSRCFGSKINKTVGKPIVSNKNNQQTIITSVDTDTNIDNTLSKPLLLSDKNFLADGTDISWGDTTEFRFPINGGRVIKVYDGDTITIAAKLPYDSSPLYRLSVRLNGIDTPEMKGKDITEDEKTAAKIARDFVASLVLNKYVRLENMETEKYGRILADVYVGDIHLNQLLLKERYAVEYDGGTKQKPISWLKYRFSGEK